MTSKKIPYTRENENMANEFVSLFTETYGSYLALIWHQGDGNGGAILEAIRSKLISDGLISEFNKPVSKYELKERISRNLSKAVFERDKYRCVHCGTHKNLTVDHIYPESKGGETSLENSQTLCKSCNSKKGVSV